MWSSHLHLFLMTSIKQVLQLFKKTVFNNTLTAKIVLKANGIMALCHWGVKPGGTKTGKSATEESAQYDLSHGHCDSQGLQLDRRRDCGVVTWLSLVLLCVSMWTIRAQWLVYCKALEIVYTQDSFMQKSNKALQDFFFAPHSCQHVYIAPT